MVSTRLMSLCEWSSLYPVSLIGSGSCPAWSTRSEGLPSGSPFVFTTWPVSQVRSVSCFITLMPFYLAAVRLQPTSSCLRTALPLIQPSWVFFFPPAGPRLRAIIASLCGSVRRAQVQSFTGTRSAPNVPSFDVASGRCP